MKFTGRLIGPYQREGVKWMCGREDAPGLKGGFLCDEMGLGKTIQIIATMLVNPQKTLIIVPKSIVTQWHDEITKFAPDLKVHLFDGPVRIPSDTADITIAPYSVLVCKGKPRGEPTILHRIKWGRVVLDEGHEVRSYNSKIFASVQMLQAPIRWVVSGTPVYNSMKDFVTLCGFIGISKARVQGYTLEVRNTYVLRRTKKDLRVELPPCDFANIEMEMYPEEEELYKHVYTDARNYVDNVVKNSLNMSLHMIHILECFLRTRQTMIHPQLYLNGIGKKKGMDPVEWTGRSKKMETLLNLIDSHPKEKTLVFCQFMYEMDHIQDMLGDRPIFRIDGSIEQAIRVKEIKEFRTSPDNSVFLIQIKAGGQGLNLQEATRVYITCPSWNPATEMQAIARSHRTGQTQQVIVRKLIYRGTDDLPSIEETMIGLQNQKATVCSSVLNDPDLATQIPKIIDRVSIRDMKKIFHV